jgi:hypothetical protein
VVLIGSSQHTFVKAADLDPAIFAPEGAGAVQRYEVTKLLTLLTVRAHQLAANPPWHLGVDPASSAPTSEDQLPARFACC